MNIMFKKARTKGSQHSDGGRDSGNVTVPKSVDSKTALEVLSGITQFEVFYLGEVREINMATSWKRDKEAQLVDKVEEAQLQGKLLISPREEDRIIMFISRHGIKVLDITKKQILQRHPLHIIAQVIQYEDCHSKSNVVFKTGQLQVSKGVFQCYVFQCLSEEQAQAVCQSVQRLFDAITVK